MRLASIRRVRRVGLTSVAVAAAAVASIGVPATASASFCNWMTDRPGDAILASTNYPVPLGDPSDAVSQAGIPASDPSMDLLSGEVGSSKDALVMEMKVADLDAGSRGSLGVEFAVDFSIGDANLTAKAARYVVGGTETSLVEQSVSTQPRPASSRFNDVADTVRIAIPTSSLRSFGIRADGVITAVTAYARRIVGVGTNGALIAVSPAADRAHGIGGYRVGAPSCLN